MNQIEHIVQERLNAIALDAYTYQIARQLHNLESTLYDGDFLSYELEPDDVTHSSTIELMEENTLPLKDIANIIDRIFGTKHALLSNFTTNVDGLVFAGMPSNVKASELTFHNLAQICNEQRSKYIASLHSRMKQSTKEERTDEFIYDWIEELGSHFGSSQLDLEDKKILGSYLDRQFKSYEDLTDTRILCADIAKMILESESVIVGDFRNELFSKYREEEINNHLSLIDSLENKYLIVRFPSFNE